MTSEQPVALVTGAGRGIGAATALALAADGWTVVAIDRCSPNPALDYPMATQAELDAVAASAPERIEAVVADVTDPSSLAVAIEAAAERHGRIDAAVAVAGVLVGGRPLWEEEPAALAAQQAVNVDAVVDLARLAIPHLLKRPAPRSGRFVAVASTAAITGLSGLAGYGATKAAVVGLVKGLAADLGDSGVTANAVCPGSTRTALLDESARVYGIDDIENFASHAPQRRLLEPNEVAAAIAWLCSPAASGVTGATIPVDAGMTA